MLVLLVLVGFVAAGLYTHLRIMARWLTDAQEENALLRASLLQAQDQVSTLSKLEAVAEAEAYVAQVLMAGRATADAVRSSAAATLSEARAEARSILDAAHSKAQKLGAQAYAARELAEQCERAALASQRALVPSANDQGSATHAAFSADAEVFRGDGFDATGVRIIPGCDLQAYELKFGKSR